MFCGALPRLKETTSTMIGVPGRTCSVGVTRVVTSSARTTDEPATSPMREMTDSFKQRVFIVNNVEGERLYRPRSRRCGHRHCSCCRAVREMLSVAKPYAVLLSAPAGSTVRL